MKKILFFIAAALMGVASLSAQNRIELGEVTVSADEPTELELQVGGVNCFMLTAPETGMLEFNTGFGSALLYKTDADWSEDSKVSLPRENTAAGNITRCDVEAGQVYYFSTTPIVDPTTVTISYSTGESVINIDCNYTDGEVFDLNDRNLEFTIDHQVTIDKTLVLYGDGRQEDVPTSCINAIFVTQYFYTIMLRDLMDYLMDGGKIATGDKFTIRLEGIRDVENPDKLYGEDGSYEITLELGEMPATLVSIDPADGSEIYTYYPEGGDGGFIVFTFSDPLNEDKGNVDVTMTWGDQEAGSFEQHRPDFTIEGNTVTVDIRGILIPEQVEGSRGSTGSTRVTITLSGLTTTDGRSVDTNYPNTGTSSVLAVYGVKKQEISFIYDFDPQNGNTSLAGYDKIMIWLNNPIMYDGVTVTWYDARGNLRSRTYTPEQVPFEWDDYEEGYVAYVSLGSISYNNSPVTVTVDNARLMNGDPVTITGTFNNTSTGINNAAAGEGGAVVKVYGVDGRLVKEGAASGVLDGLEKGVYIVNGKKVLAE